MASTITDFILIYKFTSGSPCQKIGLVIIWLFEKNSVPLAKRKNIH